MVEDAVSERQQIVSVKNPGADDHLEKVVSKRDHFVDFLSCESRSSRSSTLRLFSFTIKETALLKEPSKYPFTRFFMVDSE